MHAAPQLKGQVQRLQNFLTHGLDLIDGSTHLGAQVHQHDDKLITAKTCHGIALAHAKR